MKWAFFAVVGASFLMLSCAGGGDRDPGTSSCMPECTGLLSCCGRGDGTAGCVFTDNDPTNCGGCGIMCAAGQRCMSGICGGMAVDSGPIVRIDSGPTGMCMPSCSSSQRCCGTSCVGRDVPAGTDGRSDSSFMNCNGCGLACDAERASACSRPAGGGAAPMCMCGNFAQCLAGEVCTMSGGSLRCVSLTSDPENCGEIGHACTGDEICRMGVCSCGSLGMGCAAGSTCCGSSCIDTTADPMNCGGCGTVCPSGMSCAASACTCGGTACSMGQLCCGDACTAPGPENCGGCGIVCTDSDCVTGLDFLTMAMRTCCGMETPFGVFCDMGGTGFPDAGFPFP